MSAITHDLLLEAASPGGATCLTSVTELVPAAGSHASIAPAKFASSDRDKNAGAYAYEKRYLDGHSGPQQAVLIASKQDQLNRCEEALAHAIEDGHPVLSRIPRVTVTYTSGDRVQSYGDITLPHRVFDAHIRAGYVGGVPVTDTELYRGIRDSTAGNARALFDASPVSLVFGSWDSSRATRQGRWRSALVGEIVGFCADDEPAFKGGARTDPVGMRIELGKEAMDEAQQGVLLAAPPGAALHRGAYTPYLGRSTSLKLAAPPGAALHRGVVARRGLCGPSADSPLLRERPFIEAQPRQKVQQCVARSPLLRERPFIEARRRGPSSGIRAPSPLLRERAFIEAHAARSRSRPGRPLAAPPGAALHRGAAQHGGMMAADLLAAPPGAALRRGEGSSGGGVAPSAARPSSDCASTSRRPTDGPM